MPVSGHDPFKGSGDHGSNAECSAEPLCKNFHAPPSYGIMRDIKYRLEVHRCESVECAGYSGAVAKPLRGNLAEKVCVECTVVGP